MGSEPRLAPLNWRSIGFLWAVFGVFLVVLLVGSQVRKAASAKAGVPAPHPFAAGEWVRLDAGTELDVGAKPVARVHLPAIVQVERVEGPWLWVSADGKRGRVSAGKVQRAELIAPDVLGFRLDPYIPPIKERPNPTFRTEFEFRPISLMQFSNDRRHFVYVARRGQKRLVVLDGQLGPEFDEIIEQTLVECSDGGFAYYAVRDGHFWHILHTP